MYVSIKPRLYLFYKCCVLFLHLEISSLLDAIIVKGNCHNIMAHTTWATLFLFQINFSGAEKN